MVMLARSSPLTETTQLDSSAPWKTIPAGWCVTFKFRDDHPEFLTVYVEKQAAETS